MKYGHAQTLSSNVTLAGLRFLATIFSILFLLTVTSH